MQNGVAMTHPAREIDFKLVMGILGVFMNFSEGIKRVYVTLACLVWLITATVFVMDRPKENRNDWATANALMDDLAKQYGGVKTDEAKPDKNNVLWDDQPRSELIAAQCSRPYWSGGAPGKWTITEYAEKRKDICDRYNHAKTELPKDLAYHAAESVGILALVALGASLLWMLMAWIGRGFVAKKD